MAPIASTQRAHGDELGLLRGQLTNLRALLVLSILMTESADDEQILRLAASAAVSLGGWRIAGFAVGGAWRTPRRTRRPAGLRSFDDDRPGRAGGAGVEEAAVGQRGSAFAIGAA